MSRYDDSIARFRPYLLMLASSHLPAKRLRTVDASDIVQQTLMEAHANRDLYRGKCEAELASWLRQILRHNIVDVLRAAGSAKRNAQRDVALDCQVEGSFLRAESWLAAEQSSPSQHAVREEELLQMSRAVAELPADQQAAIVLHHLQGWKLAEVAEQLDRSESAVAGLISRGMKSLRSRMRSGARRHARV